MTTARDAITDLLYAYADAVDRGDFDAVGALFAHGTYRGVVADGVISTYTGAGEVATCLREMVATYDDGTPRTKHVTTNAVVDVDETAGEATCRSYFTVLQGVPGVAVQVIVAGRYHDTFERVDGEWRFRDRLIYSDLVGDLSRHLRSNPLA